MRDGDRKPETLSGSSLQALRKKVLQMKRIAWMMGLLVSLFSAAVMGVPPSVASEAPGVVVGRVYHIEGDLLRYVPEEKDWVASLSGQRQHD